MPQRISFQPGRARVVQSGGTRFVLPERTGIIDVTDSRGNVRAPIVFVVDANGNEIGRQLTYGRIDTAAKSIDPSITGVVIGGETVQPVERDKDRTRRLKVSAKQRAKKERKATAEKTQAALQKQDRINLIRKLGQQEFSANAQKRADTKALNQRIQELSRIATQSGGTLKRLSQKNVVYIDSSGKKRNFRLDTRGRAIENATSPKAAMQVSKIRRAILSDVRQQGGSTGTPTPKKQVPPSLAGKKSVKSVINNLKQTAVLLGARAGSNLDKVRNAFVSTKTGARAEELSERYLSNRARIINNFNKRIKEANTIGEGLKEKQRLRKSLTPRERAALISAGLSNLVLKPSRDVYSAVYSPITTTGQSVKFAYDLSQSIQLTPLGVTTFKTRAKRKPSINEFLDETARDPFGTAASLITFAFLGELLFGKGGRAKEVTKVSEDAIKKSRAKTISERIAKRLDEASESAPDAKARSALARTARVARNTARSPKKISGIVNKLKRTVKAAKENILLKKRNLVEQELKLSRIEKEITQLKKNRAKALKEAPRRSRAIKESLGDVRKVIKKRFDVKLRTLQKQRLGLLRQFRKSAGGGTLQRKFLKAARESRESPKLKIKFKEPPTQLIKITAKSSSVTGKLIKAVNKLIETTSKNKAALKRVALRLKLELRKSKGKVNLKVQRLVRSANNLSTKLKIKLSYAKGLKVKFKEPPTQIIKITIKSSSVAGKLINAVKKLIDTTSKNKAALKRVALRLRIELRKSKGKVNLKVRRLVRDANILSTRARIKLSFAKSALRSGVRKAVSPVSKLSRRASLQLSRIRSEVDFSLKKAGYRIKIKARTGSVAVSDFSAAQLAKVKSLTRKLGSALEAGNYKLTKTAKAALSRLERALPFKIEVVRGRLTFGDLKKITGTNKVTVKLLARLIRRGKLNINALPVRYRALLERAVKKGEIKEFVRRGEATRNKALTKIRKSKPRAPKPKPKPTNLELALGGASRAAATARLEAIKQLLRKNPPNESILKLARLVRKRKIRLSEVPTKLRKFVDSQVKRLRNENKRARATAPSKSARAANYAAKVRRETLALVQEAASDAQKLKNQLTQLRKPTGKSLANVAKVLRNAEEVSKEVSVAKRKVRASKAFTPKETTKRIKALNEADRAAQRAQSTAGSTGQSLIQDLVKETKKAKTPREVSDVLGKIKRAKSLSRFKSVRVAVPSIVSAVVAAGSVAKKKGRAFSARGKSRTTPKTGTKQKAKTTTIQKSRAKTSQATATSQNVAQVPAQKIGSLSSVSQSQGQYISNILQGVLTSQFYIRRGKKFKIPLKLKRLGLAKLRRRVYLRLRARKNVFTPDIFSVIFGIRATKGEKFALLRPNRIFTGTERRKLI